MPARPTHKRPELSIATADGDPLDPGRAELIGIDQSFGADASAGPYTGALWATSLIPATETLAGFSAIDSAADKVSATDPVPPVHAPALNTAPGSAQSNNSVHPAEEGPLVRTQAASALEIELRFCCGTGLPSVVPVVGFTMKRAVRKALKSPVALVEGAPIMPGMLVLKNWASAYTEPAVVASSTTKLLAPKPIVSHAGSGIIIMRLLLAPPPASPPCAVT